MITKNLIKLVAQEFETSDHFTETGRLLAFAFLRHYTSSEIAGKCLLGKVMPNSKKWLVFKNVVTVCLKTPVEYGMKTCSYFSLSCLIGFPLGELQLRLPYVDQRIQIT